MNKRTKNIALLLTSLFTGYLLIGRMPQVLIISAIAGITAFFIKKNVGKEMQNKMIALFLIVFLSGVMISLFLYDKTVDTKYYGFSYMGDDYVYGDFGTIVGDLWRKGKFLSLKGLEYFNLIGRDIAVQKYQLYSAFIFFLFGAPGGQILLVINCFLHAAIIVPVYFICRDLEIKNSVTEFIFLLFLFWPSTFCWSLFNFKEPMILFAAFTVIALSMRARKSATGINFLLLSLSLFILYCLKGHLGVIIPAIAVYFIFLWRWPFKNALIIISSLLVILRQTMPNPIFSDLHLKSAGLLSMFWSMRRKSQFSNTGFFGNLITGTYARNLLYLPFGLSAVLFLPFLLRPFAIAHVVANFESMIWWCFIPFLFSGILVAVRSELKKAFPALAIFFCWLGILILTQGNMGTLLRQKSLIYYTGFIFIALSIDRTLCSLRRAGR